MAEDQSGKRPAWCIPSARVDDVVAHGHMANTGLSMGRRTICRVHNMTMGEAQDDWLGAPSW